MVGRKSRQTVVVVVDIVDKVKVDKIFNQFADLCIPWGDRSSLTSAVFLDGTLCTPQEVRVVAAMLFNLAEKADQMQITGEGWQSQSQADETERLDLMALGRAS